MSDTGSEYLPGFYRFLMRVFTTLFTWHEGLMRSTVVQVFRLGARLDRGRDQSQVPRRPPSLSLDPAAGSVAGAFGVAAGRPPIAAAALALGVEAADLPGQQRSGAVGIAALDRQLGAALVVRGQDRDAAGVEIIDHLGRPAALGGGALPHADKVVGRAA